MQQHQLEIPLPDKEVITVTIQYSNGINRIYVSGLDIPIMQYYSASVENYNIGNIKKELFNRWVYTNKPETNFLSLLRNDLLLLPHQNNIEGYRFEGTKCVRGKEILPLIPRRINGSINIRIVKSFNNGTYLCLVKGKHLIKNTLPCLVKA